MSTIRRYSHYNCYQAAMGGLYFFFLVGPAASSAAEGPARVHFDAVQLVSCCDITTEEFVVKNPDEVLVCARIEVSSLIEGGREADLIQYLYRFEIPDGNATVVDYSPKTTLATDIDGSVDVQRQREASANASLNAKIDLPFFGKGDTTAGAGTKRGESVHYKLLPPKALVAASGTTRRGAGAYFKLRPSSQTSLEGAREFEVTLRVDRGWRGGVMHVHCYAWGSPTHSTPTTDKSIPWGSDSFQVGLYLDGDLPAKRLARVFGQANSQLRSIAGSHQEAIAQRRYSSVWNRLESTLSNQPPRIPSNWLDQVLRQAPEEKPLSFHGHLPEPVRAAVSEYSRAKSELHRLSSVSADTNARSELAGADGT